MSNENSTVNRPPTKRRPRSFSLVTYLDVFQVQDVLLKHDKQIRAYAYIEHNKDVDENGEIKPRHIHILIRTIQARTVSDICNWVSGFFDDNGLGINTLAQEMHDISNSYLYLTHSTPQALEQGKYQYSPNDIFTNDREYFEKASYNDEDNITLAVAELLDGKPLKEVALKYGRDFILHYNSIRLLVNDIKDGL